MTMRAKCSGAKLGMAPKEKCEPSVTVSPISKVPGSCTPTTSPATLSSTTVRSRATKEVGFASRTSRPVRTWWTFIPRVILPEQMRTKATRSRWARSMFAWILKTKPVNS